MHVYVMITVSRNECATGRRFRETILLDTPYHKLDAVLVFGNIQITTQR